MDPYKLRVIVLNAKSPDCIYVADPTKEEINNLLQTELQSFYNKHAAIFELEWQKDQMCAVYSPKDKAFFRARVLDNKSETEVTVLFIDLGLEETVPIDDIQPLNKNFLSIPRYQFKVKLADITAPGGSSSWPSSSCQKLRDIIHDNESYKFFISKVGETIDEVIPVELWVKLSITDGPLAPTKIEMKSISRMLVDTGFAIPIKGYSQDVKRQLAVEVKRQLNKSEESNLCLNGITWSMRNREEDTLVNSDVSLKSDSDESDLNTLSETESKEDDLSSESVPMHPEISEWIPATRIEDASFIAVPTYVDHDCFVYLHPKLKFGETLKIIEAELDKRYCKRTVKSYDKVWKVGDICIAQYHGNGKWYRAQVKKIINDKNVLVEFVDYGNVEDCEIGTIKKRIILQDIPIQSTKCIIHGLYPNTQEWSTSDLDKIHCLLVDKECEVTVLDRSKVSSQILYISITLLRPKRCELISYLSEELKMNIHNPNGSCTDSESPTNSVKHKSIQRIHENQDVDEVLIEGFLNNCQTFSRDVIEFEPELLQPEISAFREVKEIESVKENSEIVGITSSLESLSWGNMVTNETRMATSTPHVELNTSEPHEKINNSAHENISSSIEDSSEHCVQNSFPDIIDFFNDVKLIQMDMSSITKKGLKKMELEFLGHVTGGNAIINEFAELHKKMEKEIQETAENQPIIEIPDINMPCYTLYTDGKWYRGLITKCQVIPSSGKLDVTVKYVDYGNSINVDVTELREMHQKWTSLPRMAVNCRVYNLVPMYDTSKTNFALRVVSFYENKSLFAKIKDCSNRTLTVDLFFDHECKQPALLPLIEDGLFQPKNVED